MFADWNARPKNTPFPLSVRLGASEPAVPLNLAAIAVARSVPLLNGDP
jgi:hypothetical protein